MRGHSLTRHRPPTLLILLMLVLTVAAAVVTDPGWQAGKLDPLAGRKATRVPMQIRIRQKLLTLLKLLLKLL